MRGVSLRRGSFVATIVTAAIAAAFFVSPASAGTTTGFSWASNCGGFSIFGSLDRLSVGSTARSETAREPALGQTIESPGAQRGRGRGFRVTVPTYVHVVSLPDGTGNVSNRAIRDQIRVLNVTFAGGEGGYATGFSFDLAGVTRTVNSDWYYASFGSDERAMKRALRQGGDNALNIYLTTAGPYLGWAYYPSQVNHNGSAYLDGVVVDWESMLGTSTAYAGRYDQGETATHEVGHWLNLAHTFEGGCNNWGDRVADTPPMLVPTNGCPAGKDTCSEPGLDPIHNYMDYSYDTCYTEFTAGQTLRMQDAWLYYRAP